MFEALRNLNAMKGNSARFLLNLQRRRGNVASFWLGPLRTTLVASPLDITYVLVTNAKNYTKNTRANSKLAQVMGEGLLTADGKAWKVQRRIAQPAFHRKHIDQFVALMGQCAFASVSRVEEAAKTSGAMNISVENSRYTLDVVTRALFGERLQGDVPAMACAVDELQRQVNHRTFSLFDAPMRIPTGNNRRLRNALSEMDEIVYRLIREHMHGDMDGHTLMDLLLTSIVAEGEAAVSAKALRDEAMTFFLAGHETTANLLSWAYLLLSFNKDAQDRLYDEVRGFKESPPSLDHLKSLPFLDACVQEVLRLFPPIWGFPRCCVNSDRIRDVEIPGGSEVWVSPFVTQRHPDLWADPNEFKPERWLETPEAELEKGAFFPFGAGARQCIGANFARLEAKIVMASTIARFDLGAPPDFGLEYSPKVTLQPSQQVVLTFKKRDSKRGES